MDNLFHIKSLVICLVICISFLVYTTRLLDCDIVRCFQFLSLIMQTILALLSCALLLPRAIVLRAIVLRAFVTARIVCALLSARFCPARFCRVTGCNWGMQLIDGCSLELCSATPSVASSGICHIKSIQLHDSIVMALP